MWNWKDWLWPGFVTVAAVGIGALWFETDTVEADLAGRARDVLASGQPFAKVIADGRDLTLEGSAPSENAQAKAVALVGELRGVRIVTNNMGLLPIEEPYKFSAVKSDAGIMLSGFAPGVLAREKLKSSIGAALPGIAVTDTVGLARGAPENLNELVAFGVKQLGRLGQGGFEVVGSSLTLSGSALSVTDYDALVSDVDAAGEMVSEFNVEPPLVDAPYVFQVDQQPSGLVLSGYASSVEQRAKLADAAGDGAHNQIMIASGSPPALDWELATMAAVNAANQLAGGTVLIEGDTLNMSGDAKDGAAFKLLQELISGPLPGGLKLGTTDIGLPTVDPFEWRASLTDDELRFDGYLPSEELRAQLLSQANANFGHVKIYDNVTLANGAPESFEMLVKNALHALSRVDSGEIVLAGTELTFTGEVFGAAGQAAISTFLESVVPAGYTGNSKVQLKPDPETNPELRLSDTECRTVLKALGERNTVLFETGSANIRPDSYGFLDRMAYGVRRCAGIEIEVAGHTDSDGNDEQNQLLSVSRAQSVAKYLIASGVEDSRLSAVGYGESQPIADNGTDEGKTRNRRIELLARN